MEIDNGDRPPVPGVDGNDDATRQSPVTPPSPVVDTNQNPDPKPGKEPKKHRNHPVLIAICGGIAGALALFLVLRLGGFVGSTIRVNSGNSGSNQTITITPNSEDTSTAEAVAAKAVPSVVSIYATSDNASGLGSGVMLDTDGNILTNYHVIDGASSISVTIEGTSYTASVVGSDESSDLAVIRADLQGASVTPIEVGDSSQLVMGQWVMAIGSPYGLEQSVSTGIVSALYRSTMMQSTSGNTIYTNLIQTDAAINPGNSGGALVNDQGQLVGINTLIESESGSNAGIGFAIPANYAIQVANTILSGQTVVHPYIGLTMQTVTSAAAQRYNLGTTSGAYVVNVTSGSPADSAGIQRGDIITAVDDQQITSADGLILAIRSHNVGDTVQITLVRNGREQTVSVTLGSDEGKMTTQNQKNQNNSGNDIFGFGQGGDNGSSSSNPFDGFGSRNSYDYQN